MMNFFCLSFTRRKYLFEMKGRWILGNHVDVFQFLFHQIDDLMIIPNEWFFWNRSTYFSFDLKKEN